MQTHEAGYFVKELDFLNLTSVNYNLVNLLGCCKYIHQQGFPLLFLFKKRYNKYISACQKRENIEQEVVR